VFDVSDMYTIADAWGWTWARELKNIPPRRWSPEWEVELAIKVMLKASSYIFLLVSSYVTLVILIFIELTYFISYIHFSFFLSLYRSFSSFLYFLFPLFGCLSSFIETTFFFVIYL
jgi:hypothetical protein